MSRVRGVRGATTADSNTREAILDATEELLRQLVADNGIEPDDVATAIFTVTPDLSAAFPAEVARVRLQWTDGAFLSATEIPVPDAPPRCIRVLLLVNTEKSAKEMRHVYLKGAQGLRSRGLDASANGNPATSG
jgi:chorismate mutase